MCSAQRPPALRNVVELLDRWYPPSTADSWDAVGLVRGQLDQPVRRVLFAVDPAPVVAQEAAEWNADLLVVHHPLFLSPVHGVPETTPKGRTLGVLARAHCALLTAHTNADQALAGVSESLAQALGLTELAPLRPAVPTPASPTPTSPTPTSPAPTASALSTESQVAAGGPDPESFLGTGTGRVGVVPPTTLGEFAERVAHALPSTAGGVRVAGDPDRPVRRVALCGGAGDFLLDDLAGADVDVYLTSDLRHHPASEFLEQDGPALIDVAHWAAEWTWLPVVEARLREALGDTVETRVSRIVTDPWRFRL